MDWSNYFLEHEEADDAADELRLIGIRERFLSPDETLLLTPTVLRDTDLTPLCQSLHRLSELIQALPTDSFHNRLDDFAEALGYQQEVIALLRDRRSSAVPLLGRWDLFQTDSGSGWQVLEWNLGGAVSGLDCEAIQHQYRQLQRQIDPASTQQAGGNGLDALSRLIRYYLDEQAADRTIFVLDDDDQLAASPLTAQTAAHVLSRITEREVPVIPVSQFSPNGPNGQSNDLAFEVFTLRDIALHPERYDAYLSAVDSGAIRSTMPLETDLFMNKATLALLHENAEKGAYSETDTQLIRTLIPETLRVTESLDLTPFKENRQLWVLKTTVGYGGFGVTCGWEQNQDTWNQALHDAQNQPNQTILQRRVNPSQQPIVAMTPAGDLIERDSAVVLGIFLNGERFAGGLARASVNEAAVINAHNRAAVGVMRVG